MPKQNSDKTTDARLVYKDIIDLPHHQSLTHPHMSLYDRAAQFAPFAALTGYEDMVNEEARVTDAAITLGESQIDTLSQKLSVISDAISSGIHPLLTITYFVPDSQKAGGEYLTVTEEIKKIDTANRKIVLMKCKEISNINLTIDIEAVTDIKGELIDYIDESF